MRNCCASRCHTGLYCCRRHFQLPGHLGWLHSPQRLRSGVFFSLSLSLSHALQSPIVIGFGRLVHALRDFYYYFFLPLCPMLLPRRHDSCSAFRNELLKQNTEDELSRRETLTGKRVEQEDEEIRSKNKK